MCRHFAFAALLLILLNPSLTYAIDAEWLAPVSGEWTAAENWSSIGYPDNKQPSLNDRYDVTIGAEGGSYEVLLAKPSDGSSASSPVIQVQSLTINSPDATVRIADRSFLAAAFGVHIERGALLLDEAVVGREGATNRDTRISSGPAGALVSDVGQSVQFNGVVLATDFVANSSFLVGNRDVTLENSTLSFARGAFYSGADLKGVGEWRLESGQPDSFDFDYNINYHESPGQEMVIGAGVTVRSMGHFVTIRNGNGSTIDTIGVVLNQGTMIHETDGGYLYIEGFRNEGLVRVANGDRFVADFVGDVGNVELGAGADFSATGAPHFNQPVTVADGAVVWIRPDTTATADAPLQLQPGGTLRLTPEGIVPVTATGGTVLLDDYLGRNSYTVTELVNLPVTGPADVRFSGAGVDLEGGVFDYTTLPANMTFDPPFVENGTFTGPSQPPDLGDFYVRNTRLDLSWNVAATQFFTLTGTSELVQPVTVSGGALVLDDDWVNTGGITVTSGELRIDARGQTQGAISFTGGTLGVWYDTTLAEVESLAPGADRVEIGGPTYNHQGGSLDLEGGTLDLDAWPTTQWVVNRRGEVANGTITGSHDGPTLQHDFGRFTNVVLDSVKTNGGSFGASTLTGVWVTGSASTSGAVINSRIDGGLSGGTIQGMLDIANYIRGNVLFDAGSSIRGSASLGGSTGRGQRDTFTFVDPSYTLPAGIDFVSATQYDSHATVEATSTALTVEGNIRVGHATFIRGSWSDSLTLNVQSLSTHGETTVTEDGHLVVTGGPWTNTGSITLSGGEIDIDSLHATTTGQLSGWGAVSGNVSIDGRLATNNGAEQLFLTGDLNFTPTAATDITLGARDRGPDAAPWLAVEGAASVDGSLSLTLSPEFLAEPLAVGDQFALIEATTLAGQFDSLACDLPWLELTAISTPDGVLVEVASLTGAAGRRGDANDDGVVDASDYTIWRDNLGETVAWFTLGDFDGNGVVSSHDYAVWVANYGAELSTRGSAAPEPTALALLVWAVLGLPARSKLRRIGRPKNNA